MSRSNAVEKAFDYLAAGIDHFQKEGNRWDVIALGVILLFLPVIANLRGNVGVSIFFSLFCMYVLWFIFAILAAVFAKYQSYIGDDDTFKNRLKNFFFIYRPFMFGTVAIYVIALILGINFPWWVDVLIFLGNAYLPIFRTARLRNRMARQPQQGTGQLRGAQFTEQRPAAAPAPAPAAPQEAPQTSRYARIGKDNEA